MKNNEASLFVFIASVIIGILISLNINFNRTYNRFFLSTKEYQDAYNDRTKLRNEVSNLQDEYEELSSKLLKYEYGDKNYYSVIGELKDELYKNKMITGQLDVEGEGIKLTLNDGSNDFYDSYDESILDRIVHNYDIFYVINDLRNAGAEAISINGQRVIDRTEVYCDGPLLRVNGVKIAAPFYINAIGKKEVLKNYMLSDEGYLNYLKIRQIYVYLEEADNIKIQAYTNVIDKQYIAEVKGN
ncbi:DUF881 domain-containing protein [Clostridium sp. SYSU_GA19001]|uniref:DUF881 domain-containing protein n=1 Tax=Clostridium caldaquaticum TaxID=2940653 RepID=UPI0020774B1F|nr:DUF881 domain-containing protein [Clostridium caldaquaticum]MCM8711011.1 DUF881 domain-containing protein [Clostridium caldaquaticum]